MSIADKLLQLNQVKQDIKAAIETKGIPMTNVAFTEYANKILEISGGGGVVDDDYYGNYYYYFAKHYYIMTNNSTLFSNAWEHSLTVDPAEISENSSYDSPRGTAQYPNGEIEGVIIPQGVTRIGNNVFRGWQSNNKPLMIPDSVTSIGYYAFLFWTSNNQPLVIPNSVTSIGQNAFSFWTSNDKPIVIPSSVTSIGDYAFENWSLVPYVEMQSITPPTLVAAGAFSGQNNAPIYVPDESVTAYKTATNWNSLASRIFSINDK